MRSSNEILEIWKFAHEERVSYQSKPWNQSTWTIPQEIHPLKDSYINHDILNSHSPVRFHFPLNNFVVQLSFTPRVPHQISQQLSRSNRHQIVSHNIYIYIHISNQVADSLSLLYLPDLATAFLTDFSVTIWTIRSIISSNYTQL